MSGVIQVASARRALYFIYANPGAYPPLQHSAHALAAAGWDVLVLGTGSFGADALAFDTHERIRVRRLPYAGPGVTQKLHYAWFSAWVLWWALRWRPTVAYASDLFAAVPAVVITPLQRWVRVVYHEHDEPAERGYSTSRFMRVMRNTRARLARRASVCVVPQRERATRLATETGRRGEVACVWNCPARREAIPAPARGVGDECTLLYHGSIVPDRLPASVLYALTRLPPRVKLRVVGYETIGHAGYLDELRLLARQIGISSRVEFRGPLPRRELMANARECDVGLAFMPAQSDDANMRHMVGASNKPFDYMAAGLALLVSELPDWRDTYVDAGYALACDPYDVDSLTNALGWFTAHPERTRRMGEAGREQVLREWHYERQFAPVFEALTRSVVPASMSY